jgi:hypothetical protein
MSAPVEFDEVTPAQTYAMPRQHSSDSVILKLSTRLFHTPERARRALFILTAALFAGAVIIFLTTASIIEPSISRRDADAKLPPAARQQR